MRIITAIALLALSAAPAFAGAAEAQSCAASLDANGQAIFNAALPQVSPSADLKAVVTDHHQGAGLVGPGADVGRPPRGDGRRPVPEAGDAVSITAIATS